MLAKKQSTKKNEFCQSLQKNLLTNVLEKKDTCKVRNVVYIGNFNFTKLKQHLNFDLFVWLSFGLSIKVSLLIC